VAGNPKSAFPLTAYNQCPAIEKRLVERAEKKITVKQMGKP